MSIIQQLLMNRPLIAAVIGWGVAQFLKVPWMFFITRKWEWKRIFGSGGMPSSHSASTVALAMALAKTYGLESPYFALSALFAGIVMYDAAGVRRQAGKQAEVVNDIVKHLSEEYGLPEEKLKELIGHTPLQVVAGAILGCVIGLAI